MRALVGLRRWHHARRRRRRTGHVPSETVYMLHIGKTGGSFIKRILKDPEAFECAPVLFVPFGHNFRHVHLPAGARFMFCTRDPVARFSSAFASRQRMGRPPSHRPWSRREAAAFARFATANDLAEALDSADRGARGAAQAAMASIKHVAQPHTHWFSDRARLAGDLTAGRALRLRQEDLVADLRRVLEALGCRVRDGVLAGRDHADPEPARARLSPRGQANIAAHYAEDAAFLGWLDGFSGPGT